MLAATVHLAQPVVSPSRKPFSMELRWRPLTLQPARHGVVLREPCRPPLGSIAATGTGVKSLAQQAPAFRFYRLPSMVTLVAGMTQCRRLRSRQTPRVQLGNAWRRDLTLDGYPIHGPGYYWTLSRNTEAVQIFMPVADDVTAKDVIFDCHDWTLRLGLVEKKGGLIINDKVLYKVSVTDSYFTIDEGQYGERCVVAWLEKIDKEQNWYAYDRFEPVSERFLTEGEKARSELEFAITHKTFLDIEIDDKPMGQIVFGLYGNVAPRTVENFRCLCTGEKGISKETGSPLHYKGTSFHRVIPGFMIQGGQTFEDEDGAGGESIYGATFEDENLRVKFTKPWQLAMANGGPDTNGSQFFITTCRANHLSHKCVAFGEVLEGHQLVKAIESVGNDEGEPCQEVRISNCGEISFEGTIPSPTSHKEQLRRKQEEIQKKTEISMAIRSGKAPP